MSLTAGAGAVAMDEPADATAAPRNRRRRRGGVGRNQALTAGSFLLPNLILVGLFLLIPLVGTIIISFQKLGSIGHGTFLGINNFADLFQDSTFYETVLNTALFTVLTVPVSMGLGLAIAVLLNGVLPGRNLYRSIIFLPLVLSSVSIGLLGAWMFDQDNGFVNKFLHLFGIGAISWNSDGTWALISVMIVTVWQRVGFAMLIYLAGLQGVDADVLEAATVDGASPWQRFRAITFPLLGPSTFFLLVMNLIYSFQVFDTVYAMTAGGPDFSTTTIVTYAYRVGFDDHGPQQLGYAAAIGVVIYLITLGITALQFKLSKQNDTIG